MRNDDQTFLNLKSNNPEIILQRIDEIQETGTTAHFLALLDLLHETSNGIIRNRILTLFSELKSTATIPFMMEALQDKKFGSELKELLSCCWQNGLNYSLYLPVFVDLVIKGEFLIAFEAFTVIENMYGKMDEVIVNQQIEKINNSLDMVDEQKKYLLISLPSIIENIPEEKGAVD